MNASGSGNILNTSKAIGKEPCPTCRAEGRDTSGDNLVVYDDGHKYCFACSTYVPTHGRFEDLSYTYEHIPWRGISKETMRFYGVKTKIDAEGQPLAVGFKYPNGAYKVRQFAEKGFHWTDSGDPSKAGLFGIDKFPDGSHKTITITEGELDALSLYQVLRTPVVSIRSSSSGKLDAAICRSRLNSFERIYLAFDGDGPGRDAAASVAKLFDYNKVYDVRFPGGERKDANDYLRAGAEDELRQLWHNAKKFLPDNISSSLSDFKKELFLPRPVGVPYPWPTINSMTYGLRPREVVLITAQEGVGKTEVSHTLLHQLLKETDDNVGAIFLEESKQRLLQAVTGIELKKPIHLPDHGCSDAEIEQALDRVVRRDDRLHVYSHFGSDDADVLLDQIRFLVSARGCRWVVFDLISLAVSGLSGDREEKALSYLSGRLALSTQELDYGLIEVSHVNDYGQTRGSRMIGKDCHVRIDLTRDVTADDDRLRRTTKMMLAKNRPTSRTGFAGNLLFDPLSYTLSEDYGFDLDPADVPSLVPSSNETRRETNDVF